MKNSLAPSDIFYLIITAIELSAGVVANGFIVGLNCIDWAKSRTLTFYDMIITIWPSPDFAYNYVCDMDEIIMMMLVIWMFINHVSLCFANCLSVFYCVKIATFNQSFINWLKLKLSKLVPWLLLGSLLYCLVTTVTFTFFSYVFMITSHICSYRP
nr:taste receptor type 2 member 9-like [Pelodiscus sinensis]|eukprot:XP_025044388.1 taste receptor type 2 member 9-like [Pelodiscus sinensis]